MKKIMMLIALLSLVAMGMVFAADAPQGTTAPAAKAKGTPAVDKAAGNPAGRLFVDADGDGVVDNYAAGQPKGKMNRGGKGKARAGARATASSNGTVPARGPGRAPTAAASGSGCATAPAATGSNRP